MILWEASEELLAWLVQAFLLYSPLPSTKEAEVRLEVMHQLTAIRTNVHVLRKVLRRQR